MSDEEFTTIRVRPVTRDRLYEHMRGKMTADEVLNLVLDLAESKARRGATRAAEAHIST